MIRKSLAVLLSGVLVLGGSSAVFAADAATSSAAETAETKSASEDSLGALLGGLLGGEEGESIDLEGLLGSVTDENGELDVNGILGSLTGSEDGSLDIKGLIGSFTGGEGEEGSLDLSGILGAFLGEENAENALDIQALLGSFVDENGELDVNGILGGLFGGEDGSFDLSELLGGLFGGEEGELNLEELLGYVVDENGNLDLSGVLGMFGVDEGSLDIGGVLDSIGEMGGESFSEELKNLEAEAGITDGEVSLDGVEAMVTELASNPEEATALIGSLFKEGGIGAALLDMVGSTDETISGIVDTMKDDSGEYSLDRMAEALGSIEVNDEGVSIDGQEISQEDIEKSVTTLLEAFGLTGEATAESEAA